MAVSDYAIPWNPPDLTSGLSLLARSLQARRAGRRADENAKTQRMFADAQLRRMDSETARQLAEHNAKQNEISRKMEMEKAAFMERIPYLTRNPMLPAIAAQYGIQGEMVDSPGAPAQQTATPTSNPLLAAVPQSDAVIPPDAGVDAIGGGQEPVMQEHATVAPMAPAGYEGGGMDALTDEQRQIMAENVASVGDRTTLPSEPAPGRMVTLTEADVPPFTADVAPPSPAQGQQAFTAADLATPAPAQALQAAMPTPAQPATMQPTPSAPMSRNKLFRATIGGKTYDIGGQSPTTGLGEKYDALYDRYLQEPGGEKVAFAKTLAAWQAEQTSNAAGERARETAGSREHLAGQKEEFTRWLWENYHLTAEQLLEQRKLDRASREHAAASASGQAPVPPALAEIVRQYSSGELPGRGEALAAAADKKLPAKMVSGELGAVTRDATAAERAQQKREGLEATGPGIPPGSVWKNPQAATKGSQQVQRFYRVEERLKALINDVEANGERIDLDSKEYVRRMSLSEAVAAALRPYNELSSTDASMKAERAILGPTGAFGHGWTLGADLQTLKHILAEAQGQQATNLQTLLRTGGGSRLAPVLGGPPRGEGAPAADVKWVRIPARLASQPQYRGKTEVSVDSEGNITGSR